MNFNSIFFHYEPEDFSDPVALTLEAFSALHQKPPFADDPEMRIANIVADYHSPINNP